tara:strand:- start:21 stop:458 length:438 start_codon:yes stop_codon:yes gene_type:complete
MSFITKNDYFKILQWFKPEVTCLSANSVFTNIENIPSYYQLASKLNSYNNTNKKTCFYLSSKNPLANILPNELISKIFNEYCYEQELTYHSVKTIWIKIIYNELNSLKQEDEFDINYYDMMDLDYHWARTRLQKINLLLNKINHL